MKGHRLPLGAYNNRSNLKKQKARRFLVNLCVFGGSGKPEFAIRIHIASEMFRKKEKKCHGLKRYLLTFSILPTELKDSHGASEIFLGDL
jgi:hypothetical protein